MSDRNTFFFKRHQNKEKAYVQALQSAGYVPSRSIRTNTKFAIMDHDVGPDGIGFRVELPRLKQLRIPVFFYPHAARPTAFWDGIYPMWPYVVATFVIAEGHKEVMKRYGYPYPLEVSGWPYCEIKPFKPTRPNNILFGPIHPNNNGWLNEVDLDINRKALERLVSYCEKNGSSLTVRYIHNLSQNGISEIDGVKFVQAQPDNTTDMIDQADLVVGHQTFAYLAVARGKPTLMMREDIAPRSGNKPSNFMYVASWDKYRDLVEYPLDLLRSDPEEVIARATETDEDIRKWRDDMIGEPFDPARYVQNIEKYLPNARRVYSRAAPETNASPGVNIVSVGNRPEMKKVLLYCPLYPSTPKIYPETDTSIKNIRWGRTLDVVLDDWGSELEHTNSLQEKHKRIMEKYRRARQLTLDGGYDALFTIEADMVVPGDALMKLAEVDADVVYGLYVSRHTLNWYANLLINGRKAKINRNPSLRRRLWHKVVESTGVGFGCTLIRRHVLESLDFRIGGNSAADTYFAEDCMKMGYKQAHDLRVVCGHISNDEVIWPDQYKATKVLKRTTI